MLPKTGFVFKDDDELQASLLYWKDKLNLLHWNIKASIERAEELPLKGVSGTNRWTLSRAEAIIKLLDPIDYYADYIVPLDHEITLVHELLHLYIAPFTSELDSESLEHIFMERAIDVISKTLVDLKRSVPTCPCTIGDNCKYYPPGHWQWKTFEGGIPC